MILVRLVAIAACLLVAGSVSACKDQPDAGSAPGEITPGKVCEVVSESAVSGSFGEDLELVDELSGSDVCVYQSADGFRAVTVRVEETRDSGRVQSVLADSLANSGVEAEFRSIEVLPDGADDAWSSGTEDESTYILAARSGGQMAIVQAVGFGDDRVAARSLELAKWILGGVKGVPFDSNAVEAPDCESLKPSEFAAALGLAPEAVKISQLPGSPSCMATIESELASIEIHQPFEPLTTDQLAGLGRRRIVDGTEYSVEPDPVDGLGDHAVWVLEPQSGASGDLYAVWGDETIRLTVTGTSGDPERLKSMAVKLTPIVVLALGR